MSLFVGKIQPKAYVSNIQANTNNNPLTLGLNRSSQGYNTNHPRTASDYPQECFTDGYFVKAAVYDYLA